jgi:putative glutamine amidotransferase
MMVPTIGIVMDWQERGSFSPRPHYAIRESYFRAVWQAGGLPVGLPLLAEAQEMMLTRVQALVVPGGDYPSPSRWYADGHGIPDEHPRSVLNEELLRRVLGRDMPLLAICAGHQELCAATGGLLYWRVAESVNGALLHRQADPTTTSHAVRIMPGSLLEKVVGAGDIQVNSLHHEAVRQVGPDLRVSGTAPDGVIEAIEAPAARFALGVQWHPEFLLTEADRALFAGLVQAARATPCA